MERHLIVLQAAVHLVELDVVGRELLAAVHEHCGVEAGRGAVVAEGIDMHGSGVCAPVVPFLVGVAQIGALSAGVDVESSGAGDLRGEVAVAGHLHVDGLALGDGERGGILRGGLVGVVAADVYGAVLCLCAGDGRQQE